MLRTQEHMPTANPFTLPFFTLSTWRETEISRQPLSRLSPHVLPEPTAAAFLLCHSIFDLRADLKRPNLLKERGHLPLFLLHVGPLRAKPAELHVVFYETIRCQRVRE
jgi:hypothetical protein